MSRRVVEFLLAAAAIAALFAVPPIRHALVPAFYFLAAGKFAQFQHHLRSMGAWAPFVSIVLMAAEAVAIPFPVTIIMVANGLVFGVWGGAAVSLAGGVIGAAIAYVIGRRFGRAIIGHVLPEKNLASADRLMHRYGGWAIVVGRWIPGIPGDPMSYAAGVTRMSALKFLGLSLVGLVPANLVTAFVGEHVAGDVPLGYWLAAVSTVLALWFGWRYSTRRRRSAPPH